MSERSAREQRDIDHAALQRRVAKLRSELSETDWAFKAMREEFLKRVLACDPDKDDAKLRRYLVAAKMTEALFTTLVEALAKGEQAINWRELIDLHYEGRGPAMQG